MPVKGRRCQSCHHKFDIFTFKQAGEEHISVMERDDDVLGCPKCDSEDWDVVFGAGIGIELGGGASTGKIYPYFDRGLGCQVDSASHRRQIMKARGLIEAPEFDEERMMADICRDSDRMVAEHEAHVKEMEESPHWADYRRARDRGALDEHMRKMLGD